MYCNDLRFLASLEMTCIFSNPVYVTETNLKRGKMSSPFLTLLSSNRLFFENRGQVRLRCSDGLDIVVLYKELQHIRR